MVHMTRHTDEADCLKQTVRRELGMGEARTWGNDEAAAYLGCTAGTLRAWVSRRKVPFIRVNGLVRFRKSDLDRWLQERLVPAER